MLSHLPLKKFCEVSFWDEAISRSRVSRTLLGGESFEVVVVGGGITGLSAARELSLEGHKVAVLEAGYVGNGASGRACGQIAIDLGTNPEWTLGMFGREKTGAYAEILKSAIADVEKNIQQSGYDCDFTNIPNVMGAVHSSHAKKLEKFCTIYNEFGFDCQMLGQSDLSGGNLPNSIKCGYKEPIGGSLDPAKYCYAMSILAEESGVTIFENSRVEKVIEGKTILIKTKNGVVSADKLVLACNAFADPMGVSRSKIVPLSVSSLVSEPLTKKQLDAVGWSSRHPIHTSHRVIENLRLTPRNRILVGTKKARVGFGSRAPSDFDRQCFRLLENTFRERFPQIPEVKIDKGWTGRVAMSTDFLPVVGNVSRQGNVYYGAAYCGHGLSMSGYVGKIIKKVVCNQNLGHADFLVNRKMLPVPPEPFRWLAVTGLLRGMSFLDHGIDRKARKYF